MAVHNGAAYLQEAITSILGQNFTDFEFVVVDDASHDGSLELLAKNKDSRLHILENAKQLGLSASLNLGIGAAVGEYVARMDHDDVSLPGRLSRQTAFLDAMNEVDIVGTWARTLGLRREQTWRYPVSNDEIRSEFVFSSSLVHSSVMWRKVAFYQRALHYDPAIARAQDYELWTRAAQAGLRFANLPEVQLRYRIHPNQVGRRNTDEQQEVANSVRERELARLGLAPSPAELVLHNRISRWELPRDETELAELERWLLKVKAANTYSGVHETGSFSSAVERRWWVACRSLVKRGRRAWVRYSRSELSDARRAMLDKGIFWSKALLADMRVNFRR